jgi:hypothetical protein
MIAGADHIYGGEENQVATQISKWIENIAEQKSGNSK